MYGSHLIGRTRSPRKQCRYYAARRDLRDREKFDEIVTFGERLPAIRETVARDLALRRQSVRHSPQ